jgi:branched-chain amino acid transport system permease protein/neutral amino acid transport system permease protein
MSQFASAIGFGIVTAAILAVSSVGFTLQFSVTNVFNLSYGSVMTGTGFIAYGLNNSGLNIWASMVLAALGGGVISVVMNWLIFSRFIRHGLSRFGMVIVTIATGLICDNTIQAVVGPSFYSYNVPLERVHDFGGILLTNQELIVIAIAIVMMTATHVGLKYTRLGTAMRGLSVNSSLARACGVPTRRVVAAAWFASGVMAGIGAVALFLDTGAFGATTGSEFLIIVIAAAVLGGVGSAEGAVVGALVVGIATELAAAYWRAELKDVVAFVILIVVLLVRPQGIFSQLSSERTAVG